MGGRAGSKRPPPPPRKPGANLVKANEQQLRFALEFVKDFNAREAAIRAGYSARSAYSTGPNLLRQPAVQAELARLRGKVEGEALATAREVIGELRNAAFMDPADLFDKEGRLLSVHDIPERARRALASLEIVTERVGEDKDGEPEYSDVHKLKMINKLGALDLLGKYLKLWIGAEGSQAEARVRFVDLSGQSVEVAIGVRTSR